MRRASHSAGAKWFKWEDPIMYVEDLRLWWDLVFWLTCVDVGMLAALVIR